MQIIAQLIAILLVLYIFEITKAVVSTLQGDTLPKENGMLTLNIFKYFEPIGFFLTFAFGYGWGQPAPVSPRNYKNKKAGLLITYTAPIILSFVFAVAAAFGADKLIPLIGQEDIKIFVQILMQYIVIYFINIAVFNLIPIPPMCGYEIIRCFLSPNAAFRFGQDAPLMQMGFLFLWFFGFVTPLLNGITAVITGLLFG